MDRSQVTVASTVASTVTTVAADKLAGRDPGSGTRLGDFTLLRQLGRGAQGEVYEARDELLGRLVALKVLPPYLTFNPERVQRFKREAEAGGRLDHPNTVGVHSVGERDGYHYISQELVAGGRTLGDEIAAGRAQPELPRDWFERMAHVFVQVAEAVHAAHEAGIIHRDLKPGNILLTPDGQPKVADFGLAMVLDDLHRSRSGELIGTPFYMSPEQATGGRGGLDRRTDVFSLGTTLYEALTLGRPFDGETRDQVIERIQLHDPPDPRKIRPSVPRDLAVICMKALEKRCDRRFQSADEFASELGRYLRHEPILVRPPGVVMRAGKWLQRHPVPTAFTAVFVLVVVLLVKTHAAEQDAQVQREKAETSDQKRQRFVHELLQGVFEPTKWEVDRPRPRPGASDPYMAQVAQLEAFAMSLGPEDGLPEEQCHLLTAAGAAYAHYSMFEEAERCLVLALEGARRLDPTDPENTLVISRAARELGNLRRWSRRWDEATALLTEARDLSTEGGVRARDDLHLATVSLADVLFLDGRMTEAEGLLRSEIEGGEAAHAGSPHELLLRRKLGYLLMDDGRPAEALALLDPAYEHARRVFPEIAHAEFGATLAVLHDRLGRLAAAQQLDTAAALDQRAEALFTESIDRLRALTLEPNEEVAEALSNYGSFLSARKRFAEARPILEEARDAALRGVGPDHFVTLHAENNLGTLCFREGLKAEAEALLLEVVASDRRVPPYDTRPILTALKNLANLCADQKRFAEAAAYANELVARTPTFDRDYPARCQLRDKIQVELDTSPANASK